MSTHNNQIVILSSIVSEFANAFLRLDFKLWKDREKQYGADFKRDYFNTQQSKDTRETIAHVLRTKILPNCERYPDSFNSLDIESIIKDA